MKIGILTFHNACNYGAVLQCYALQEVLTSLGHDVEVIDYRNSWVEAIYKPFSFLLLKHYIRNPRTFLKYVFTYFNRKMENTVKLCTFSEFVNNNFYLADFDYVNNRPQKDYDIIFIGSDQLWGLSCLGGKFDNVYLGNFSHEHAKIVGYAISADLKSLQTLSEMKALSSVLNNYTAISFREKTNADYVGKLTNKNVDVCVDPTLLLPYSGWNNIINNQWKEKNYVVLYQVRYNDEQKKYLIEQANKIANEIGNGCTVVDLNGNYKVEDFISAIKYAKLVITSSFHATVFSLIFRTQFYSIKLNDGCDGRYISLLQKLNLEERIVNAGEDICYTNSKLPDYSLDVISQHSIDFIKKHLK